MARKTIDVDLLVEACNNVLALPDERLTAITENARAYRAGVMGVAEQALAMADAYKGFSYLPSELAHDGTLVIGYDDTRRCYAL